MEDKGEEGVEDKQRNGTEGDGRREEVDPNGGGEVAAVKESGEDTETGWSTMRGPAVEAPAASHAAVAAVDTADGDPTSTVAPAVVASCTCEIADMRPCFLGLSSLVFWVGRDRSFQVKTDFIQEVITSGGKPRDAGYSPVRPTVEDSTHGFFRNGEKMEMDEKPIFLMY